MAYLGNDLQVAFPVYRNIDDISGSFNSSTTSFPLRVSGVAPVPAPLYSQQCLISVGGVVQRPDDSGSEGFRLSNGNIIFASAPTTGADFFGVILAGADYVNAGGNFPSGTAGVPSITFNDDLDTGIYNSGINQVSIATGGSERLRIDSAGQIESVSLGTAAAPAFSFTTDPNTGIYSPGADQVVISTGGSGRLFVDASGRVGVGTASPGENLSIGGSANLYVTLTSTGAIKTALSAADANGFGWAGSTTNHAFALFTNNAERLRITSAGLVGVGTSVPRGLVSVSNNTVGGGVVDSSVHVGYSVADFYGFRITNSNDPSSTYGGLLKFQRGTGAVWSDALTINNAGNVGIGTTSPSYLLDVAGTARIGATTGDATLEIGTGASANRNAYIDLVGDTTYTDYGTRIIRQGGGANADSRIQHRGTGALALETAEAGASIVFLQQPGERARIDSSGRLLVGTSSAFTGLYGGNNALYINSPNGQCISYFAASAVGARLDFLRSRNATTGSHTVMQSGDDLGGVYWGGSDGSAFIPAGFVRCEVDGIPGANDMPGRLVFSTTADGASSPTERMRITNNGANFVRSAQSTLWIGTDVAAGTTDALITAGHSAVAINNFTQSFKVFSNGNVQNTNNSYTAISDIKLKENIVDAGSQWADLKSLRVRNYNLKEGQTHRQIGLIAQEVEPVSPGLVYESPDRDAEGNDLGTVTKSVNYSVLYMKAVKALQEAMERIETLEAKVAALESA